MNILCMHFSTSNYIPTKLYKTLQINQILLFVIMIAISYLLLCNKLLGIKENNKAFLLSEYNQNLHFKKNGVLIGGL